MTKEYMQDLALEVGGAFLGGALVVLTAAGTDFASLSVWQSAAIAGGSAALVTVKCLLARLVGDKESTRLRR